MKIRFKHQPYQAEAVASVVDCFKEISFKDDETKINTEQIFKQLAPSTDVRVI